MFHVSRVCAPPPPSVAVGRGRSINEAQKRWCQTLAHLEQTAHKNLTSLDTYAEDATAATDRYLQQHGLVGEDVAGSNARRANYASHLLVELLECSSSHGVAPSRLMRLLALSRWLPLEHLQTQAQRLAVDFVINNCHGPKQPRWAHEAQLLGQLISGTHQRYPGPRQIPWTVLLRTIEPEKLLEPCLYVLARAYRDAHRCPQTQLQKYALQMCQGLLQQKGNLPDHLSLRALAERSHNSWVQTRPGGGNNSLSYAEALLVWAQMPAVDDQYTSAAADWQHAISTHERALDNMLAKLEEAEKEADEADFANSLALLHQAAHLGRTQLMLPTQLIQWGALLTASLHFIERALQRHSVLDDGMLDDEMHAFCQTYQVALPAHARTRRYAKAFVLARVRSLKEKCFGIRSQPAQLAVLAEQSAPGSPTVSSATSRAPSPSQASTHSSTQTISATATLRAQIDAAPSPTRSMMRSLYSFASQESVTSSFLDSLPYAQAPSPARLQLAPPRAHAAVAMAVPQQTRSRSNTGSSGHSVRAHGSLPSTVSLLSPQHTQALLAAFAGGADCPLQQLEKNLSSGRHRQALQALRAARVQAQGQRQDTLHASGALQAYLVRRLNDGLAAGLTQQMAKYWHNFDTEALQHAWALLRALVPQAGVPEWLMQQDPRLLAFYTWQPEWLRLQRYDKLRLRLLTWQTQNNLEGSQGLLEYALYALEQQQALWGPAQSLVVRQEHIEWEWHANQETQRQQDLASAVDLQVLRIGAGAFTVDVAGSHPLSLSCAEASTWSRYTADANDYFEQASRGPANLQLLVTMAQLAQAQSLEEAINIFAL